MLDGEGILVWPRPPRGYEIPDDDRPPPRKEDVYMDTNGIDNTTPEPTSPGMYLTAEQIQDDMYMDNDVLQAAMKKRMQIQRPILLTPEKEAHRERVNSPLYLDGAALQMQRGHISASSLEEDIQPSRSRSLTPTWSNLFRRKSKSRSSSETPSTGRRQSKSGKKKKIKKNKKPLDLPPEIHAIDSPPQPYFHGQLDEIQTNDRLWQTGMHEGLFLVREVVEDKNYVLSVVREDKVEHYTINRSERPNGKPGHHFVLNDVLRLWLCCCVDEVIAEILTVPELRYLLNGSPKQLLQIALGRDGQMNFLQGIVEHKTGLLDPRVHMTPNGKVARLGSRLAEIKLSRPPTAHLFDNDTPVPQMVNTEYE